MLDQLAYDAILVTGRCGRSKTFVMITEETYGRRYYQIWDLWMAILTQYDNRVAEVVA